MLDRRVARLVLNTLDVEVVCRIERIADPFVDRDMPDGAEEPQTVLHDRTADVEVEVLHVIDEVAELEAPSAQVVGQIIPLPARCRAAEESAALDSVAAVLGNQVDADATRCHFGRHPACLKYDLLRQGVVVVCLNVAVAHRAVYGHAIDWHARVAVVGAVGAHVGLFHALRSAYIGPANLDAWNN